MSCERLLSSSESCQVPHFTLRDRRWLETSRLPSLSGAHHLSGEKADSAKTSQVLVSGFAKLGCIFLTVGMQS